MHDFLTSPLTYTRDQRTSRDVCRDACAFIECQPRTPSHQKALYAVAILAVVVVALVIFFEKC